jgi:hypothetical protein
MDIFHTPATARVPVSAVTVATAVTAVAAAVILLLAGSLLVL